MCSSVFLPCFATMQSPKWRQYCWELIKMNWAPSHLHECEHPLSRALGCLDSVHFSAQERCRGTGTQSERGLRAVFTRVSKVICIFFGFAYLRSVIGWQNSHHFLSQWEAKPIASCTRVFSRAWCRLRAITSNSDWLTEISSSVVISQSDCHALLSWKPKHHFKIENCHGLHN